MKDIDKAKGKISPLSKKDVFEHNQLLFENIIGDPIDMS
jgi:hypothetical protein